MRQGQQQHRRGRNRNSNNNNNNNRKGQNPLTRNFESSGPDVKIRGTPAHVAEKYMSLARDALSAGDPVLAENYLQHAEHYNRIILAFREQQSQSGEAQSGAARQRDNNAESAEAGTVEEAGGDDQDRVVQPGDPQPSVAAGETQKSERGEGRRPQRARGGNGSREGREARAPRTPRAPRAPREPTESDESSSAPRESRSRDRQRFGESDQQPEFLRRPVRRPKGEESDSAAESDDGPAPAAADAGTEQE